MMKDPTRLPMKVTMKRNQRREPNSLSLVLTASTTRDALDNHQKDIFGLDKTEKFFTRPKLQCEQCNYRVGCEATMANHMKVVHKAPEAKCDICPFKSHLKAILLHHVANEHRHDESNRKCSVCKMVLRDKKNLAGHYFSKHNILDYKKYLLTGCKS